MVDLAHLRRDYDRDSLDDDAIAPDPLEQFRRWFDDVLRQHLPEPNAMTLATATPDGRPSVRPVLLKSFDERGLVWFTNYHSRKGQELAANPHAALQFYWPELERVVRVEGPVETISAAESDAYFSQRPLAHRLGAWASPQSQPIPNRTYLLAEVARYALRFGLTPPRPPHWGGYRLIPERWEFWQGRPSRLHDRILFTRQADGSWARTRLAP
ncbi:MAG: pyridoxamine 5'-phosphate oxidase [Hydrogenophilus sp.]|nr:pyridoxamine 5'-phosphate oxidase [Hydrogenophilus sp.]